MRVDVLLPLILFSIAVAIVFIHAVYEKKLSSLLGGEELHIGHAALLVVATGIVLTVLVFIPEVVMRFFFLFAYSSILFLFTYMLSPKWWLAILSSVLFLILYLSPYWNAFFLNFFGIIFAICISVYMGSLFTWKSTIGFVSLMTVMDVFQVPIAGFLSTSAEEVLELGLPVGLILLTFPSKGLLLLGLGDIFLLGLLSIQTTRKYGSKIGLASIVSITFIFMLLQTILLNSTVKSFPATVLLLSGWLTLLGAKHFHSNLDNWLSLEYYFR